MGGRTVQAPPPRAGEEGGDSARGEDAGDGAADEERTAVKPQTQEAPKEATARTPSTGQPQEGSTRVDTGARGQGFGLTSGGGGGTGVTGRYRELLLSRVSVADGDADSEELAVEPGCAGETGDEIHDLASRNN